MIIGIVAAIALPAYQDYTSRVKTKQALSFGRSASRAVGAFYESNQRIPGSLVEARFTEPMPKELQDLRLNTTDGVLQLVLASGPLAGKTIRLVPATDAQGRVIWQCRPDQIAPRYLPPDCR
jgi:type II secretory pathway pseudopilin PulG